MSLLQVPAPNLGDRMRVSLVQQLIPATFLCLAAVSVSAHAQSDTAKLFKTNCALCHSDDGSGNSPSGKALQAKDLRSDEVQKQSDAALNEVITKGKGKMTAFGAKIKPDDVTKLVAYVRTLAKK
jgi:mono/diheme cytochrome c family protein